MQDSIGRRHERRRQPSWRFAQTSPLCTTAIKKMRSCLIRLRLANRSAWTRQAPCNVTGDFKPRGRGWPGQRLPVLTRTMHHRQRRDPAITFAQWYFGLSHTPNSGSQPTGSMARNSDEAQHSWKQDEQALLVILWMDSTAYTRWLHSGQRATDWLLMQNDKAIRCTIWTNAPDDTPLYK